MNKTTCYNFSREKTRLVDRKTLAEYLSVGTGTADRVGKEAGAKKTFGRRVLYDLRLIDRYIDKC